MIIKADLNNISQAVDFVRSSLEQRKVDSSETKKAVLITEEILAKCVNSCPADSNIRIESVRSISGLSIRICCLGDEIKIEPSITGIKLEDDFDDLETESIIQNMILNSYGRNISHKYQHSQNIFSITVNNRKKNSLWRLLIISLCGLLTGFLLKFCPQSLSDFINENILKLITTLIMNLLKMLVVPMIFFSVSASVAGLNDIKAFGRMGVKILVFYSVTSVIAVVAAWGVYSLFPLSDMSLSTLFVNSSKVCRVHFR